LNAVEIEEAISALAEQPFDVQEFLLAFLQAFGNKETTINRQYSGASNKSDVGVSCTQTTSSGQSAREVNPDPWHAEGKGWQES
jgi:hypothetical protein